MAVFFTDSTEKTESLGAEFAKTLKGGEVVLLKGELGAGKTVFVKGMAKGMGISDEVLSPTYAYMNNYSDRLYHFDCYRLSSGAQAEGLGLTDYFFCGGVCVVEWWENIVDVLPEKCVHVCINKKSDMEREIVIE